MRSLRSGRSRRRRCLDSVAGRKEGGDLLGAQADAVDGPRDRRAVRGEACRAEQHRDGDRKQARSSPGRSPGAPAPAFRPKMYNVELTPIDRQLTSTACAELRLELLAPSSPRRRRAPLLYASSGGTRLLIPRHYWSLLSSASPRTRTRRPTIPHSESVTVPISVPGQLGLPATGRPLGHS